VRAADRKQLKLNWKEKRRTSKTRRGVLVADHSAIGFYQIFFTEPDPLKLDAALKRIQSCDFAPNY